MSKRFLLTLTSLLAIGMAAAAAIFLTKGYTFSPKEGKVMGTGILSVTSIPDGASVFIDGHLNTATNANISGLAPKTYKVKIVKEGFIPWEKEVAVVEGLVTEVKATLFPSLPTIYPLTYNGAKNPSLSPDGQKLAFAVPLSNDGHAKQKGGIWVWTLVSQPVSFTKGGQPQQIVISSEGLDFAKASLKWSPDSKSILAILQEGDRPGEANQRNYLLPVDKLTSAADLRDLTPTIASTLKEWEEEQKLKEEARLALIADVNVKAIASSSAQTTANNQQLKDSRQIKWSPDETKFIIIEGQQNQRGKMLSAKVYDLLSEGVGKIEKGNLGQTLLTGNKEYKLPEALNYIWLPDSRHVILINEGKISIAEFDGGNVAEIYAGNFEGTEVFPWPDSSKLVILTSFNTPTASKPNLFGINLK